VTAAAALTSLSKALQMPTSVLAAFSLLIKPHKTAKLMGRARAATSGAICFQLARQPIDGFYTPTLEPAHLSMKVSSPPRSSPSFIAFTASATHIASFVRRSTAALAT
jgi:hypothetical protein